MNFRAQNEKHIEILLKNKKESVGPFLGEYSNIMEYGVWTKATICHNFHHGHLACLFIFVFVTASIF